MDSRNLRRSTPNSVEKPVLILIMLFKFYGDFQQQKKCLQVTEHLYAFTIIAYNI